MLYTFEMRMLRVESLLPDRYFRLDMVYWQLVMLLC